MANEEIEINLAQEKCQQLLCRRQSRRCRHTLPELLQGSLEYLVGDNRRAEIIGNPDI
jgi:hypothetical protein